VPGPSFTQVGLGATPRAIGIGLFTVVGAEFIGILKTATDMGLHAAGLRDAISISPSSPSITMRLPRNQQ